MANHVSSNPYININAGTKRKRLFSKLTRAQGITLTAAVNKQIDEYIVEQTYFASIKLKNKTRGKH